MTRVMKVGAKKWAGEKKESDFAHPDCRAMLAGKPA